MANSAIQVPVQAGAAGPHWDTYRNKLINGRFDVWQRGTTFPGPPFGPVGLFGFYTADRWNWSGDDDGGSFNNLTSKVEQIAFAVGQTDVPNDPVYHLRFTSDIAGGGGSEFSTLVQRIENVSTFSGQRVTLSFWAKGGADDILVNIRQYFGSGGSADVQSNWTVVTTTASWKRYTVVFNVPSVSGKTIAGGDDFLAVKFTTWLGATIAVTEGTVSVSDANPLDLSNVQFEIGEIVDPQFEVLPLEIIWGLGQRYYQKTYDEGVPAGTPTAPAIGVHIFEADGIAGDKSVRYPVPMRTTATLVFFDPWSGAPFTADHPIAPGAPTGVFPLTGFTDSNQEFGYEYGPGAIPDLEYSFHWEADAEL